MKIRTKLGLTYLTVSFLALVVISTSLYVYVKNVLTNDVLNHLNSVSSIQKHRIEAIIAQNLERIRLVTSRTQLRLSLDAYVQTRKPQDYEKIRRIIQDALASIESFNVISILDLKGKVIISTDERRLNHDYHSADFYPVAIKKNNAEHFFLDEDQQLNLYLSGPLLINDNLIGILLIESGASNIVTSLSDFSGLGKTGETILGRQLNQGEAIQYLSPLRFDKAAALRRSVSPDMRDNVMVKALSTPGQRLEYAIDYRGHEVLAATDEIPETHWGLVVKLDKREALEPIRTLVQYLFLVSVIVMIVIVIVSYLLANVISRPIIELTHVAHDINGGNLSNRAVIKTHDEIGELAQTFNNMANTLIHAQHDLLNSNKELESHRDHLEEMVAMRTRELEKSIQELEAFSYSVSHDLRSPLRAIDGYAHILLEDFGMQLPDDGKECFHRIRMAAQRMGLLIDDLLELSNINRKELTRSKIDLSAKVQAVMETLKFTTKRKVECTVQPNLFIYGDESLIDVVVNNLIGNAWKYTGSQAAPQIEFGELRNNESPVYYVKDNGIGFESQYAEKIFGPFQRLVRQDEYPGTGIGLATVSRVIQRHGGRIWAEGELGKGAAFYFTVAPN